MITKLWYSVQNCGDGSAYPKLMESKELCELDQEHMDEGWGEPCYGWFTIESEGSITIRDEVATVQGEISEIEEELAEEYMQEYKRSGEYPDWFERLENKLAALKKLGEK